MKKILALLILSFLFNSEAFAKYKKEDFINFVSTNSECMAMDLYKEPDKNKKKIIVFLHGDEGYLALLKDNNIDSELLSINAAHSFRYIYTNNKAIELGQKLVN